MNDMNDGPLQDSNPQPLAYQANALPTELLGLAKKPNLVIMVVYTMDVIYEKSMIN